MRDMRVGFAQDMKDRYPDSDTYYGPETLPEGMYEPDCTFLVLYDNAQPVGCIGLRKLPKAYATNMGLSDEAAAKSAEGKSLYLEPAVRNGVGAALLMRAVVQSAIDICYEWLYGNTGANQPESQRVLSGFGKLKSVEIPIYDPSNPLASTAYRLDLRPIVSV